MILAQERAILKGQRQFEQMAEFVRHACVDGRPIHEVERGLWEQSRRMALSLMGAFVQGAGTGDLGPTLEHEGRILNRLKHTHERRYVSVFGELSISRHVYGTRETQKHELVPLDAWLDLPEHDFSQVLQDWDQNLCVKGPYDEARESVLERGKQNACTGARESPALGTVK